MLFINTFTLFIWKKYLNLKNKNKAFDCFRSGPDYPMVIMGTGPGEVASFQPLTVLIQS